MENNKILKMDDMQSIYRFGYEFHYTREEMEIALLLVELKNDYECDVANGLYYYKLLNIIHEIIEMQQQGLIKIDVEKLREEVYINSAE